MGTGKSTLGFHLARKLSMGFIDLDSLIEEEAGLSVSEIFRDLGEERFRALEREAVRSVVSGEHGHGIVLATGGGTVADPESSALLKGWGHIICLRASIETILERTGRGAEEEKGKRPLLDMDDREAEIKRLLGERESAYSICDMSIDTSVESVSAVVQKICDFIEARAEHGPSH